MTNRIVAAVFDTYPSRQLLQLATKMVGACPFIEDIIIFGVEPLANHSFVRVNAIKSIQDYNELVLVDLYQHIPDKHVLIFQWDGFPVEPEAWDPHFLNFDYIGAPHKSQSHNCDFLNGGFSIRSPKLNKQLSQVIRRYPNLIHYPEDAIICHLLREKLEAGDCKFPDPTTASRFSFELGNPPERCFGFHGVFNLPFLLNEQTLVQLVPELAEKVSNANILHHFLHNAHRLQQFSLLNTCLEFSHGWIAMEEIIGATKKVVLRQNCLSGCVQTPEHDV